MQGTDIKTAEALARGDLEGAGLSESEHALLEFAGKITRHAYKVTEQDTQHLRELGWTDEQLAETVYVASMFALFNRIADAFGLESSEFSKTDK